MATIKQLVGTEKAEDLFALKDLLKRHRILDEDPLQLNRTKFEAYMAAKAEAIILDQTVDGADAEQAFANAKMYLERLDVKWRAAAKVYNETHAS